MDLLENKWSDLDKDRASVLCQNANFQPGILFLYVKAELFTEILKLHAGAGDYAAVVAACKRFGPRDPNLWIQALELFAPVPGIPDRLLSQVLVHIGECMSSILTQLDPTCLFYLVSFQISSTFVEFMKSIEKDNFQSHYFKQRCDILTSYIIESVTCKQG
jgi:hypothetical protein